MSTPNFLRVNNDCATDKDKEDFIKLVEILSNDGLDKLKEKATTCYRMISPDGVPLDAAGLKKLKTIFPIINSASIVHERLKTFSRMLGGKRKSKKRHYKHIVKMKTTKTTKTAKTLRDKILKRRRSRKRDRINRRKSRKINLYK